MTLAKQVKSLSQLEKAVPKILATRPSVKESVALPAKKTHLPEAVTNLPSHVWASDQVKYEEDVIRGQRKWWKPYFLRFIYIPFVRFCVLKLEVYPPDGKTKDGRLWFLERQGNYLDRWRAEQDAARYKYGFVTKLPLDSSYESETCSTVQLCPNSPAHRRYERNGYKKKIEVDDHDLRQLEETRLEAATMMQQRSSVNGK